MSLGPGASPDGSETDLRPIVVGPRRDPAPWIFGALAVLGAVMLFGTLDAQRRAATAPATFAGSATPGPAASPAPLYIPLEPLPPPPPPPPEGLLTVPAPTPPGPAPILPAIISSPPGFAQPTSALQPSPPAPERPRQTGNVVVYDQAAPMVGAALSARSGAPATEAGPASPAGGGAPSDGRARAVRLRQLAATVPQGTLVPAVLETALDSTRPGFVRALVTQDVRGFDGSRVLIPRGSRLFGEYQADLAPGQRRAFVRWTRLVRPDGTAIALDSPAADALGRAGVAGRVNNHFLERFGSALLQSTVSLGVALASRSVGDSAVIVTLPGAAQSASATAIPQTQPTLTVDAGTTVTVFVAHDLSLPTTGARP